ncbi:recombinase RecT [Serratia oryzae]|uniref:recombinase RecT n=1 Tax=Serratia oryzae TaxID=2034155 RepID=UPI0012E23692|nr:recombinase RecT [Serratia oryzae]
MAYNRGYQRSESKSSITLDKAQGLVLPFERDFTSALSDKSIKFKQESVFAIQSLMANSYLAGIAISNQASLRNAIINVAAIGISLNPASKLAYLVPRSNAVCLDISYMGLMHIAQQSGAVQWCQGDVVRRTDKFKRMGISAEPCHEYEPFAPIDERGDMVGAYTVIKTDGGDFLTHTMRIADIFNIRDRSTAWLAYVKDNSKTCPWVTDEEEMVKKTCVKQAAKYWPRRERLDSAIQYLNTELGEGVDFTNQNQQQKPERDITPISDASLNRIGELLKLTGRTEAKILEAAARFIGRAVEAIPDLTEQEAVKVIQFMEQRYKKMQESAA